MNMQTNPIIVDFPLRGEWMVPNTPGKKIPSHETDQFGQRYAYDFLQVNWDKKNKPFYSNHGFIYLIFGVPLNKCFSWGQEIYSPCDGKVIKASDGYKERPIAHLISDLFVVFKNALMFNPEKDNIQSVIGNYIILEISENVYALFAHLQRDSIVVTIGETIKTGQVLGKVGHSGNSTAPHLHFQLMDSSDLSRRTVFPVHLESTNYFKLANGNR